MQLRFDGLPKADVDHKLGRLLNALLGGNGLVSKLTSNGLFCQLSPGLTVP